MREVYPVGTRVKNIEFVRLEDGSPVFGKVVEKGPSIYGTTELPERCMFIALEDDCANPAGRVALAGSVFVGTSDTWHKVEPEQTLS